MTPTLTPNGTAARHPHPTHAARKAHSPPPALPALLAASLLLAGCAFRNTGMPAQPAHAPTPATAAAKAAALAVPPGLDDGAFAQWLQQQRGRLHAATAQAESRYAQAEAACWQRFAVNDCLSHARAQRRAALADVRQQELALNAHERQRTAAKALARQRQAQ